MAYGVIYKKDFPNVLVICVQEKVEHLDDFRTFLDIALILLSKEEKSHHSPPAKVGKVGNNSSTEQCPAYSVSPTFSQLPGGYFPITLLFNWDWHI